MSLPIAEAPSYLPAALLREVDRNDDDVITMPEVEAYERQAQAYPHQMRQLTALRNLVGTYSGTDASARTGTTLPADRTDAPGVPGTNPGPRSEDNDRGWFGGIGEFFSNAIKWLGDLGDTPLFQVALGAAGFGAWFFPPLGFIAGTLGFLTSASSVLSGLINEDREVNWWHIPIGFLHASSMFNPVGGWTALGGALGYMTVEKQGE